MSGSEGSDSSSDEEPEYEVERLLAESDVDGITFYLVKWKDYPDEQCTWEPLESFNSDETIQEWETAKSDGDVLDDEFLTDLQLRMDRFQGQQNGTTPDSEGPLDNADTIEVNDERESSPLAPPKGNRMGSDPSSKQQQHPPQKSTSTRGISSRKDVAQKKQKNDENTVTRSGDAETSTKSGVTSMARAKHTPAQITSKRSISGSISHRVEGANLTATTSIDTARNLAAATKSKLSSMPAIPKRPGTAIQYGNKKTSGGSAGDSKGSKNPAPPTSSAAAAAVADRLENARRYQAGQRFRNLSHQNNARKKARLERAPDVHALNLIPVSELEIPHSDNIAHNLPTKITPMIDDEEPLFIPEREETPVKTSPERQLLQATARSEQPASEFQSEDFRHPDCVSRMGKPAPIVIPTGPRHQSHSSTPSSLGPPNIEKTSALASAHEPLNAVTQATTHQPQDKVQARSSVSLDCSLWSGEPIGTVRIIDVPKVPIANSLLSMSRPQREIRIDIPHNGFVTRTEYDSAPVTLSGVYYVQSQPPAQRGLGRFLSHLEQHDVAALWGHPTDDHSMLFYSDKARSWKNAGHNPSFSSQARLYVAFLKKAEANEHRDRFEDPRRQRRPSMSNVNEAMSGPQEVPQPRGIAIAQAPEPRVIISPSLTTPRSPGRLASADTRPPASWRSTSISTQILEQGSKLMTKKLDLDFDTLIMTQLGKDSNFSRHRLYFFVTFSKSHHHEASYLRQWLESHVSPSQITSDSDENGWQRFSARGHDQAALVFFHDANPKFDKIRGLGDLLSRDVIQCCSLSFGSQFGDTPLSVKVTKLFPRGTVFLITESNLINDLDHTALIIAYFKSTKKKTGWQILFRPRIRSWLWQMASKETDKKRCNRLLDVLVMVQDMMPGTTITSCFGETDEQDAESLHGSDDSSGGDDANGASHVMSPASLPNYDDSSTYPEAVKARDLILLDYFLGFAVDRADRYRRFWAFCTDAGVARSCHIHFEDPKKFVVKQKLVEDVVMEQ